MPTIPDLHRHATHDQELVAAYAAGDATGADLDTAIALVAGCAACAALHHDLRAIAAALPTLPAPARSRDFRLSPEQAAALRPTGWRRLAGVLAGPRFSFAAPLGAGLAALGLATLLLTGPGLPLGMGGATSAERMQGDDQFATAASPAAPTASANEPEPAPTGALGPSSASQAPADGGSEANGGTSNGGTSGGETTGGSPTPGSKSVAPDQDTELPLGGSVVPLAGAMIAVAGAVLVVTRLAARRIG
jgi:hypothetical protein